MFRKLIEILKAHPRKIVFTAVSYTHLDVYKRQVVGSPFSSDDLIGAVPHPSVQLVQVAVVHSAPKLTKLVQIDARHIGPAPNRQLAVPVLSLIPI